MKKWLLPLLGISTSCLMIIPFMTSCAQPKSETDVMMDLYKKNQTNDPIDKSTASDYFQSWMDLDNDNSKTEGINDINWCLEYSLFSYFMLCKGVEFTTGISLKEVDNVYQHIPADITPIFKTTSENIIHPSNDKLTLSYSGYLQLNILNTIELTNGSLSAGDSIQIIYTFTNSDFTISNIQPTTTSSEFWGEKIDAPTFGDDTLLVEVKQNNNFHMLAYDTSQSSPKIPNYFNEQYIS